MSLNATDIAYMKTYINGLYSASQLIRWTNPDTSPTPASIDDDVYTNMINSAYQMYTSYYSETFSIANASAVDKLAHGVIMTMQNWRNEEKYKIISEWYTSLKKGKLRQQLIVPLAIENASIRKTKRDVDSSFVTYLGQDTGDDDE